MMDYSSTNISFTSRCRQIEMARSACRKLDVYSPTKQLPFVLDLISKNEDAKDFLLEYTLETVYNIPHIKKNKMTDMLRTYMECNKKLDSRRNLWDSSFNVIGANELLEQVGKKHVGNCGESAESISVILNMNGVKNTYCTTLYEGEREILHEVCLFNNDGSPIDKINNKKTIIADPWLGIVDFVNNALTDIQNACLKRFNLNAEKKLSINPEKAIKPFILDDDSLKVLRAKFPQFILK